MSIVGISDSTAQQVTQTTVSNGTMDKDDFLNLLVTQMKHQDPLNPMSNQDMAAQLAQFSTLETLNNMQETLESQMLIQQSMNNSFMTSLIGKNVKAYSNGVTYSGDSLDLDLQLASEAANVTVNIYDEDGTLVRTIDAGAMKSGDNSVTWDGKNSNGEYVDEGNYTFEVEAEDSAGNTVSADTLVTGYVAGIQYEEGIPYLLVNGQNVSLSSIISILDNTGNTGDGKSYARLSGYQYWQ